MFDDALKVAPFPNVEACEGKMPGGTPALLSLIWITSSH